MAYFLARLRDGVREDEERQAEVIREAMGYTAHARASGQSSGMTVFMTPEEADRTGIDRLYCDPMTGAWRYPLSIEEVRACLGVDILNFLSGKIAAFCGHKDMKLSLTQEDAKTLRVPLGSLGLSEENDYFITHVDLLAASTMPGDMEYRLVTQDAGRHEGKWDAVSCMAAGEGRTDIRAFAIHGVMQRNLMGFFYYVVYSMPWGKMPDMPLEGCEYVYWPRKIATHVLMAALYEISNAKVASKIEKVIQSCTHDQFRMKPALAKKLHQFGKHAFTCILASQSVIEARRWDESAIMLRGPGSGSGHGALAGKSEASGTAINGINGSIAGGHWGAVGAGAGAGADTSSVPVAADDGDGEAGAEAEAYAEVALGGKHSHSYEHTGDCSITIRVLYIRQAKQ